MELGCINVPLHTVYFKSELVSGCVQVGMQSQLPVEGVDLILGNDLAGGKVSSQPIVVDTPEMLKEVTEKTSGMLLTCQIRF